MKMRLIAGAGLLGLMTTSAGFAVEDDCDAYGALLGTADLAGADTELSGVSNKDYFGTSMVSGDFNLDGETDFAIGATGVDINGAQSGAVYVFFGPTTALGAVNPAFADVVLNGGSAYTKAGASLAAFDADGDGADDLLIGASPAGISANKEGVAYLMTDIGSYSGDVDLASQSTARFLGDANAHDFGTVVANVGDIDNDGAEDFIIGAPDAPGAGNEQGVAHLFYGGSFAGDIVASASADATFQGVADKSFFGGAASSTHDLNGDGTDDFVIGAATDSTNGPKAGAAYVFKGNAGVRFSGTVLASEAESVIYGLAFDRLGSSVSPAGDIDQDGYAEVAVGAYMYASSKRGAIYGISPGGDLDASYVANDEYAFRWLGENGNDQFGTDFDFADLDLDGDVDLVAGAQRADGNATQSGAAYVVHGPHELGSMTMNVADFKISGAAYLDFTGSAVLATEGTINGQETLVLPELAPYNDVIVGSWKNDNAGRDRGTAAVFFGGQDIGDLTTYYVDSDSDGWGDPLISNDYCAQVPGWVANDLDCEDGDATIFPGAPTNSDPSEDRNCDGLGDDPNADGDADGFAADIDCDDSEASVNPDADELCDDGIDNNCDFFIDDGTAADATTFFADSDNDGYGDDETAESTCADAPTGIVGRFVVVGGDCNDSLATVNPGYYEVCDGFDNDCNSIPDDGAVDAVRFFADMDQDGYGDFGNYEVACDVPGGFVINADDCDDGDNMVGAGNPEVCDFVDNDCDGMHYKGGAVASGDAFAGRATAAGNADRGGDALLLLGDQNEDGTDEIVYSAPQSDIGASDAGAVYITYGDFRGFDIDLAVDNADGSGNWDVRIVATRRDSDFGGKMVSGDFNDDGVADLVVGARGARVPNVQQGAAYVFYGPIAAGSDLVAEDADVIIKGRRTGDEAGAGLAVGDFDGDGVDDLAVGAPNGDGSLTDLGRAFVFYGGALSGDYSVEDADASFEGPSVDSAAGAELAFTDLNNDGTDDLVVAGPNAGNNAEGEIYFIYGSTTRFSGAMSEDATLGGTGNIDKIGYSLAGQFDYNGDGNDDLLVGTTANRAYLINGGGVVPNGSDDITSFADLTFLGEFLQRAGEDVAGVGDVNGDGYDDFMVSAHRDGTMGNNAGAAYLVYGQANFTAFTNGSNEVMLEDSESFGRLDPVDAAAGTNFPTYSASNFGFHEGAKFLGQNEGDQFGTAIAGGGDINGDGSADVLVGAPRWDFNPDNQDRGAVYAFFGGPYGVDDDVNLSGQTTYYWDSDTDGQVDENLTTFTTCPMHAPTSFADPLNPVLRGQLDDSTATDCDDTDPLVYLGAPETNGDGVDSDCDGTDDTNDAPTGSVTLSPSDVYTADDLTATVTVNDLNGDPLSVTYTWTVNGAEVISATNTVTGLADGSVDSATLSSSVFAKNDVVAVTIAVDDGRVFTPTEVSASTTIKNTEPVLSDCSVTPTSPDSSNALVASYAGLFDADVADGSALTVGYQWRQRFGPLLVDIVGETAGTLDSCVVRGTCNSNDVFLVECTPNDGTEDGLDYPSNEVTIANSAPTVTDCVIDQAAPYTNDSLTATVDGEDFDGDNITWAYAWSVNGVVDSAQTTSTFPSSSHARLDVVRVLCTPIDEFGAIGLTVVSDPVTILNTPPSAPTIDLTPNAPLSEDDLEVTITAEATDVDGDSVTYRYYWTRNGAQYSNPTYPSTNASVPASATARGELWSVTVAAFDSIDEGPTATDGVLISNTLPTVAGVNISPTNPITTDSISLSGVGFYDEDNDPENYNVVWYVDGAVVSGQTSMTLDSSFTSRGDTVSAAVSPADPYGQGAAYTTSGVTVVNGAPSAPVVSITPNPPGEFDPMNCNVDVDSVDPDNDTVTYTYAWYSDGVNPGPIAGATLSSTYTSYGERWYCTVLPNDGFADGDLGTSAEIAIQDLNAPSAPVVDAIDRYTNTDTVDFTGTCEPGALECSTVTVTCVDGTGTQSSTVACNDDGLGNGDFATAMTIARGQTANCSAVCADNSANASLASNTVVTEVCAPEDTYENVSDIYGDSSVAAVDGFATLFDDNSADHTMQGNIVADDTYDWYEIPTSDDVVADRIAGVDTYNFELAFAAGVADYRMVVWRGSAGLGDEASSECAFDTDVTAYSFFAEDTTLADKPNLPTNPQACSSAGSPFYNECADFSATYWVRVNRAAGEDCTSYTLQAFNGRP